ncbi:hypothetical protein H4N49_14415 [Streptomyces sp. DHE17-7]|nr:hypothetical protein [Streptomyces sp. DHE17-7]
MAVHAAREHGHLRGSVVALQLSRSRPPTPASAVPTGA